VPMGSAQLRPVFSSASFGDPAGLSIGAPAFALTGQLAYRFQLAQLSKTNEYRTTLSGDRG